MSVKLTWLGHSAFALEIDAHAVVLDPFLSDNPLGAAEPNDIAAEDILLSHGQGDRLGDTGASAKRTGARGLTHFEISYGLDSQGVKNANGLNVSSRVDCG